MQAATVYTFRATTVGAAGRFTKHPTARHLVAIDLSPILPPTATITTASVASVVLPAATPDSSVLISSTAQAEGQTIRWMVQGGVSGTRYQLIASIRDSLNQFHRQSLMMTVR